MSVKERLTEYLSSKNISKSAFGREIGVSSAYISSIRKSIQSDKLKAIALKYPDLNTKWLLTGEGKMLRDTEPTVSGLDYPTLDSCLSTIDSAQRLIQSLEQTIESQQRTIDALLEMVKNLISK